MQTMLAVRWSLGLSLLVLWMLLCAPIVQAADTRPSLPPVHLPLRKAPPPGHAAIPTGAPQGYIPCDIVRAYHLDLLHSSGTNGAGQKIAIVAAFDNPTAASDLHSFDAALGLPDPAFQVYNLGASGTAVNTAWEQEINLDIEWAHAAAPGAAIALVEAPTAQLDSTSASLLAAVDYAVNVVGADVVSMSWGGAEFTGEAGFDTHFPSTATQTGKPVMYVAATGDLGFGTSWPAASPAVLAVGGTSLAPAAVGNDRQQTHFDCSGMQATPGVNSQNEKVWGTPNCSASPCAGTGGGISTIEPKPTWQSGLSPSGGRATPDVAMLADPATGVALYTNGAWSAYQWGGTSLATPLWAGVIALFNQQRHAQNQPNLNITPSSNWAYQLTTLNDILTGSSPGRPSDPCVTTAACVARAGYDLVTGRGSPVGTPTWESLGGSITSAPDAASQGTGRLDVFARGASNDLQYRSLSGGQWSSWKSLGGVLTSAPGVVSWSPGRLDVFVRGSDNALWHRAWLSSAWSGWESLGGVLTSGPDVASWSSGRLDIFVRGSDNGLWHKWWNGAWSGWESHGGVLASDPGAVSWGVNRVDAFVRGSDDALWHKSWDGVRWTGWEPLGGGLTSGPDPASPAVAQLDIFALTASGTLQHLAYAGRWGGWSTLGGQWASDPGVVSQRNATADVFEEGVDGQLWHTTIPSPSL